VVWKNDKAHFTLTDGQTDAGAIALCADGRTLYTAGYVGTQAVVWKDADLLYTLTDGSSSAEATAAFGGDGASIAQRYLLRACRGDPPGPNAACRRKIAGCEPWKE